MSPTHDAAAGAATERGVPVALPPVADRTRDALARAVATMDRLRSPGGCPWDAEQTHASLLPYLLEEAHEVVEAVEADDRAGLREELGDVLLQVLFHARLAQEHDEEPFDVADVADGLVAKLVRRHPHVFAPEGGADQAAAAGAPTTDDLRAGWETLKRAEKSRASALDGVPPSLGALARTQKLATRASRAGLAVPVTPPDAPGAGVGERLLALVLEAERDGLDAEGELRRAAGGWEAALRAAEGRREDPAPRESRHGEAAAPPLG
ncbi:MazG family protein [Cellulomonas endophytica]|uniref:MazG family protein n=1 Tax=Cellulomonas endophytica TaxID=2494735 RepID=UPI0010104EB8|nr:MazG family protein [Cellulomonas endophytica]